MTTQPIYVPVLKGKEGEFAALEALDPLSADVKPQLLPLIEIPSVPYDYANERPAKSLDDHVAGIADRLRKCWPSRPVLLDLPWFDEERLADDRVALAAVLADCVAKGVHAVPVVARKSSVSYLSAAGNHASESGFGACVRLLVEDFEEDVDLSAEVDRTLNGLEASNASSIDLVLDLEDVGTEDARAVLIARSIFSMIPRRDEWRHVVLVGASFPEDLSEVDAATTSKLPRREWSLWKTLQKRPGLLPRRDMIFGDYAIAHPVPKELDPRVMLMSANIRYTTPPSWLIVKGRNVRQYGFDQYFELCKTLVDHPEYSGRDYSWGDRFISDCATELTGPGNATTWRKVGTNHHLTLVAREIAKLNSGS
jgi:hypothetical protein